MKMLIATLFGTFTLWQLLFWLVGNDVDCDALTECLKDLDV